MNIRIYCFLGFLALHLPYVLTQTHRHEWAYRYGGDFDDTGVSVAIDDSGYVYHSGIFVGTVDFDPGPGTFALTGTGVRDIFVQKLDAEGNFIWAKKIEGLDLKYGASLKLDDHGHLYMTGRFHGTVDFDPDFSFANLTSAGSADAFVVKWDTDGNFLWAKQLGGTDSDFGMDIELDGNGNVYVSGTFYGTADFDPGPGTALLTSAGFSDNYLVKLDTAGNFVWVGQMGGGWFDAIFEVEVDALGNVWTTGLFTDSADFDPGPGTSLLYGNNQANIFVQKLDPSGNFLFAKGIGSESGGGLAFYLDIDDGGNAYVSGVFDNSPDFDPGPDSSVLTSEGMSDVFLLKLNGVGDFQWVKRIGGPENENARGVRLDADGNIFLAGSFRQTVDFDPGEGSHLLTSNGEYDIFVEKLDAAGNLLWVSQMGGPSDEDPQFITLDAGGNLYTTGYFTDSLDIDPGQDTLQLVSIAAQDAFLAKWESCGATTTFIDTTCESFTLNNETYTTSGLYSQILTAQDGCDSVISLSLHIQSLDTTIEQDGSALIANATGPTLSYQWIKCDDDSVALLGETHQIFNPKVTGSYAVILMDGWCTDTSECIAITALGIDRQWGESISVYPSPTSDLLLVDVGTLSIGVQLDLYSVSGQLLMQLNQTHPSTCQLDLRQLQPGMYLLRIQSEGKTAIKKVFKQ